MVVAEVSGTPSKEASAKFGWDKIFAEHKSLKATFEAPNEQENAYELLYGMDYDMHLIPIRMAARIVDPDAFVISSAAMKTHNMVVATMTIKNMVLGAAMTPAPGKPSTWADSDKRKFHVGIRAGNYNIYLGAKMMVRNWGVGLVDGFEGMEGNGPVSGTPVPSRIALASTDFLAVDRVGLECMGIDAGYPGYLNYCAPGRRGPIRSDQDRRGWRQDRRCEEEVPAARRRGPHAGVARPDAGPAAEPGPQPAPHRTRNSPLTRDAGGIDPAQMRAGRRPGTLRARSCHETGWQAEPAARSRRIAVRPAISRLLGERLAGYFMTAPRQSVSLQRQAW